LIVTLNVLELPTEMAADVGATEPDYRRRHERLTNYGIRNETTDRKAAAPTMSAYVVFPLSRTRRLAHEWIADNTFRTPKTRGCGVGLPARDVCGNHVAKSEMGYKSLGASSEKATKAQHCRAEVHLFDIGWVPVDPADARKVVFEEPPGNLHDVALPGSGIAIQKHGFAS
jgi:hypothetical protein